MVETTELRSGLTFGPYVLNIGKEVCDAYSKAMAAAVEPLSRVGPPPLFIIAATFGLFLQDAPLAKGTIHVRQEASFYRAAVYGETLKALVTISSVSHRAGKRLVIISIEVSDETDSPVSKASALVTSPVESLD